MKAKKKKSARVLIILECVECVLNNKKMGISRYHTSKNRRNNPEKLERSKYCSYCNKHTTHKEIK